MRKSKPLLSFILFSIVLIIFTSKFAIAATYVYTSKSSTGTTYGGGASALLDSSSWNCYAGGEGVWYVRVHVDNGNEPGGTYDCPQDIDATSGSGTCDAGAGYYYLYNMVVRVYFDESAKECMCMNTGHDSGSIDTCGSDDYGTGSGGNACWTSSFCCGDDANEYWMQADVGATHVCCDSTSDCVISGSCINSGSNSGGYCCHGTSTASSCSAGTASCSDDGYAASSTCYYNEACTAGGYTAPTTAACLNAACNTDGVASSSTCYWDESCTGSGRSVSSAACLNAACNADGLDSSGTCYWDETCTGTGRTVSSNSCASGSSSCSDDGYAVGDSCYYDEACIGSGYTAPTVDVSQQVCSHHIGTCPGSDCVYYTQCNERNCGGTGWQCYSTTSDTPCASSCYDCNDDDTCDPTDVADKGACYCTANCAGGLTCNAEGYCVDGTESGGAGDCYDGIDNDMDTLIDCADPNCAGELGPSAETCCQEATKLTDCSSYTTGDCGEISCTSNECGVAQNTGLCTTTGECGSTTGSCNAEADGSYTCLWTSNNNLCTNDEMCGGALTYLCQNICSQGGCLYCYSECQVSVDDGDINTLPNNIGQCVAHGWWTSC